MRGEKDVREKPHTEKTYWSKNSKSSEPEMSRTITLHYDKRDDDDGILEPESYRKKTENKPGIEAGFDTNCTRDSINEAVSGNRKIWSSIIHNLISSRLAKVIGPDFIPCNISQEESRNEEGNEYIIPRNSLSWNSEEGVELDEDSYKNQIAEIADCVAKAAVFRSSEDEHEDDDVDSEERNLIFSVRREIATSVIYEKLMEGYVEQDITCLKCGMPLMQKNHEAINCVVCPVLVTKIDNALKVRREKVLKQKAEQAEKDLREVELKRKADLQALEVLKRAEINLKSKCRLLVAAANVAEEQAQAAKIKYATLQKHVEEARKVSSGAWNVASEKSNQFKKAIQACEEEIEKAVNYIEEVGLTRQQIKDEMDELVRKTEEEHKQSEKGLYEAHMAMGDAQTKVEEAAEAVRLALLAKEAADSKLKRCQDCVSSAKKDVSNKMKKLDGIRKKSDDANKEADQELENAIKDASKVEKESMAKVEAAQTVKLAAEASAKQRDESRMQREAKAQVAERVFRLAEKNEGEALTDANNAAEDLERTEYEITKAIATIEEDNNAIKIKELFMKERINEHKNLEKELMKHIFVEKTTVVDSRLYLEENNSNEKKMIIMQKESKETWEAYV